MKILIAELDFTHSEHEVILRIYECEGEYRQLLRIQDLYNFSRNSSGESSPEWNETDQRLLKQLWPEINKSHLLISNLQVIKLSRIRVQQWLEKWRDVPDRFIEKSTQSSYSLSIPKVNVKFALECLGAQSRLSAVITSSDGTSCAFYETSRTRKGNQVLIQVHGKLYEFEYPLPAAIMEQIFSKQDPLVPTDKLTDHLPALLHNRLDLLEGPSVRRISKPETARIELISDGADVLIALQIGSLTIELGSPDTPFPARLIRHGTEFEVIHYEFHDLHHIYNILNQIQYLPNATTKRHHRIAGTTDNMAMLYRIWQKLSGTIPFHIDPILQTLFTEDTPIELNLTLRSGSGWYDIEVGCRRNGKVLSQFDLDYALMQDQAGEFHRTREGQWLRLDSNFFKQIKQQLADVDLELGTQRLSNLQANRIIRSLNQVPDIRIHQSAKQLAERIIASGQAPQISYSAEIDSMLRPYQKEGIEFLNQRFHYGMGCLLADDMGLGKTLQTLGFLAQLKKRSMDNFSALVVCPASVVNVWLHEGKVFTPELRLIAYVGIPEKRQQIFSDKDHWEVLIATYAVVRLDQERLQQTRFTCLILDEAQQIKNPGTDITSAIKSLNGTHRIALTGTPLENKLSDLWSIIDFLNPGYLESESQFKEHYGSERGRHGKLAGKIAPLMLRRTKDQVAPELPPRTIETILIPMSEIQEHRYREELMSIKASLKQFGVIEILAGITRLRQICCHPELAKIKNHDDYERDESIEKNGDDEINRIEAGDELDSISAGIEGYSAKLDYLMEKLQELREEGHSVLVFSQFTGILDIIEHSLVERQFTHFKITGETSMKKRTDRVREFQDSPVPAVFLLSLKAAGTGLTLTKADYVFIFDPWWNPAVEIQAIDRTHRIGQNKPVFAYRLAMIGTVEENVLTIQEAKQQLFNDVIEGDNAVKTRLTAEDLVALL